MNDTTLKILLDLVKCDLQISFSDDDNRIENIIKNGVNKIKNICGVADEDFLGGGRANALLLAYCRRDYDGDLTSFDDDYMRDIMFLKNQSEVGYYDETTAENI